MLKTLLGVALSAAPFLFAIAGCSYTPPDPYEPFVEGDMPRTAAIFCNIEKGRECASDLDALMGVDLDPAKQYTEGFWAGRSAAFGIDRSPAALAACGGKPQKVLYHGPFPEGNMICLNPMEAFKAGPGMANFPGTFPGRFETANTACQAWCKQQSWIDGDGNPYSCSNIAWQAVGASSPVLNVCTAPGTPLDNATDLRKKVPQAIVWGDAVDVSVNGNSLSKAAGGAAWDAGAASTTTLDSGDGYVEFTAIETDKRRMVGLAFGPLPDFDPSAADITYAVRLSAGRIIVVEYGSTILQGVPFNSGDRIRVGVVGGAVQYFVNEMLFYTSDKPIPSTGYPMHVSVSLFDVGATIVDAKATF
jgi:hypothetical protein